MPFLSLPICYYLKWLLCHDLGHPDCLLIVELLVLNLRSFQTGLLPEE